MPPAPILGTVPTVGISWSNDGGFIYGNEIIRQLGRQSEAERIIVLKSGQTSNIGRRWRLRVSGEVHVAFLGATQDSALQEPLMATPLPEYRYRRWSIRRPG